MTQIGSNPTQNAELSELLPINCFITDPDNPRKKAEFIGVFKKYIMKTDLHEEYQKSISMPKGHGFALTPYKGALGIINAIP